MSGLFNIYFRALWLWLAQFPASNVNSIQLGNHQCRGRLNSHLDAFPEDTVHRITMSGLYNNFTIHSGESAVYQ